MKYVVVQLQIFSPFLLLEFFDLNYICEGREEREVERREGGRQEREKEGKRGWERESECVSEQAQRVQPTIFLN